jgi:hypothetical protein
MLRTIACLAVLALPLSTPLAAESPDASTKREALQQAADKTLVEMTRQAVDDIYTEFAPGLEEDDDRARKRLESIPIEITDRRMLTAPGVRRPLLFAVVSGGKPMATASTGCDLAVVFEYADDGPEVSAHKPVCTGGRTARNMSYDGLSMARGVPLLTRHTRQHDSRHRYTLFRVDRGEFESVLSFSTTRPSPEESAKPCGAPNLTTRDLPGDATDHAEAPGIDARPRGIVATVVCRRNEPPASYQLFSRLWTWTDDGYTEQSMTTPDAYSPQMDEPPRLGGEPEPDDADGSSD